MKIKAHHRPIIVHAATGFVGIFFLVFPYAYGLQKTQGDVTPKVVQVAPETTLPTVADTPAAAPEPEKTKTSKSVVKPAKKVKTETVTEQSSEPQPETTSQPDPIPAPKPRYPKHMGANIKIYGMNKPYAPYNRDNLIAQLDWAKELGSTDVRSNVEESLEDTDDFVNLAKDRGLNPMLIVEPNLPDFYNQATYDQGYNYAINIAKRYRGKVKYYQLGNEASGVAIKKNYPGNKKSDYDDGKYAILKEWLKGLSEGIDAGDPDAYRMISANWLGVGIFDRLVEDNIQFELIGWNWYSDMGNDLIKEVDGADFSIPEYLKKYPKDFWVVELSRQGGTLDGNEQAQSDFLKEFMTNASSHNNVNGMFVFPLTDMCPDLNTSVGKMGIIRLVRNTDSSCTVEDKKPAFNVVKEMFSGFKK